MTYRGRIQNGAVVLDDPIDLPDGSRVQCELISLDASQSSGSNSHDSMYSDLMEFAGFIKGTPSDASRNHDYYP
ncbi:MAG: hypothetical protein SGI88_20800 [Candidatus Hydrogenedentes bacterium]|nr:hypothetical protein [Candidatus Hydrogenedentota bacterium]